MARVANAQPAARMLIQDEVGIRGQNPFNVPPPENLFADNNAAIQAFQAWADVPMPAPYVETTTSSPQERTLGGYLKNKTTGLFGIEVEVEGANLLKAISGKWTDIADGSLRGDSREYILRKPLDLKEAKAAVCDLKKALDAHQAKLDFSFRTSVHVHVNVLSFTKQQLLSFLYLSHLFESALVRYSGEQRVGNRFCLRCSDAEDQVGALYHIFTEGGFQNTPEDRQKYSAINICPLTTQGSVEFRSMRGTLDENILHPWLDVLYNIWNLSQEMSVDQIALAARDFLEGLSERVFGEHLPLFQYPGLQMDVRNNYSMLIEMPYLEVRE